MALTKKVILSLFFISLISIRIEGFFFSSSSDKINKQTTTSTSITAPKVTISTPNNNCGDTTNSTYIEFHITIDSSLSTNFNCDGDINYSNCSLVSLIIDQSVCELNSKKKSIGNIQEKISSSISIPAKVLCKAKDNVVTRVWVNQNSFMNMDGVYNTQGSSCEIKSDLTPPSLLSVTLSSSDKSSSYLKIGDNLILTIAASEPIATPSVTIMGKTAAVTSIESTKKNYTASITITESGLATYSITFQDLAGNKGTTYTQWTSINNGQETNTSGGTSSGGTTSSGTNVSPFIVVVTEKKDDGSQPIQLEGVSIAIIAACVLFVTILYSYRYFKTRPKNESLKNQTITTDREISDEINSKNRSTVLPKQAFDL
eukprot:c19991_g1_i1.p1 GENE.c19991_g1_i1~~c19991_g1_i1.p1  ORF type:complete len:372 (-),score=140.98 c19991_g1_i1:36-1151(-)